MIEIKVHVCNISTTRLKLALIKYLIRAPRSASEVARGCHGNYTEVRTLVVNARHHDVP